MQTKNIRVGHGIVVCVPQFNHPIRVAERAAVLDILSGGRLEFGTGRSATWTELGGFRANPDVTKKTWDEFVHTIPQMWMHERFGYEGEFFSMPTRAVLPKPYQKPHPPMWVAVSSPGTEFDAADRGMGALGVNFTTFKAQEQRVQEYRSRIQNCTPVGAFVNDQLASANFLFCHEDSATGVETGGRMIGTFQYLAGQLDMAKEAWPTKGYPSPGLLAATRRSAASPAEAGEPPGGHRHRQPRSGDPGAEEVGVDRRRPGQLHPQRQRADPPGAGSREPASFRPRSHAGLQNRRAISCLPVAARSTSPPGRPTCPTCPPWPVPRGISPGAHFLQINWEVEDAGRPRPDPAVAAPVDPAVRLVLRESLPGVTGRAVLPGPGAAGGTGGHPAARPVPRRRLRLAAPPSEALRDHWGYPVQLGEVDVAGRHDQVRFRRRPEGRTVVDLAVHTADVINGSDLMTFDNLHLVRLGDEPAPSSSRSTRSTPSSRPTGAGPSFRSPIRGPRHGRPLRLASPIIGFTFRADTDLVPVRFVIDSVQPAITSTTRVR